MRLSCLLVLALSACAEWQPQSQSQSQPQPASPTVHVKLIAFNDLHGNLESPHRAIIAPDPAHPANTVAVPAGGAAQFATLVAGLAAQNPNHAVVAAGDLTGASPLVSALFLDEPTLEVLNHIGLDFSSVGNHEFDKGVPELLRKQNGGCEQFTTLKPCAAGHRYAGASFAFLAANVIDKKTGQPIFPAYGIKTFDGVKIGFIGLTLRGTDKLVSPAAVAGVDFLDEADTINALVPQLHAAGANTIVVLLHQGGHFATPENGAVIASDDPRIHQTANFDGHPDAATCPDLTGEVLPILDRLDPSIALVISGHTHNAYVCNYKGFLLTSAANYGRLVTDINLDIERASGRVVAESARNRIVASDAFEGAALQPAFAPLAADSAVDTLVKQYAALAQPLANRTVGRITATFKKPVGGQADAPLGELIADANLAETRPFGAQIAFLTPGSVRTDLDYQNAGLVTYGAVFQSQPFGNNLITMTLSGAQIKTLLEQQWQPTRSNPMMLQVSKGFSYRYDSRQPLGSHVLAESIMLDGQPLAANKTYRVTVSNFMAYGGDSFSVLKDGVDWHSGPLDVDAFEHYLQAVSPVAPVIEQRVTRIDTPAN